MIWSPISQYPVELYSVKLWHNTPDLSAFTSITIDVIKIQFIDFIDLALREAMIH